MANVIDKALDLLKLSYDDDDDDYGDSYGDEPKKEKEKKEMNAAPSASAKENAAGGSTTSFFGKPKKEAQPVPAPQRVSQTASRTGSSGVSSVVRGGNKNMESEIVSIRPKDDSSRLEIADILLSGKTVLINMEVLDLECAQRIVDFTAGVCYAIKGDMRFPSKYLVVAVPDEVELSGSYEDSSAK